MRACMFRRNHRVSRGVDVHSAVLDIREIVLKLLVHALGDGVRIAQRQCAVDRDLGVHINPAAEQPCLEIVHAHDAGRAQHRLAHGVDGVGVGRAVNEAVDALAEDAEGHLEDEQADDDRRDGVEDRQAEPRTEHARKAADGRQRIRAMVPCLGLERHGADALGGRDRVPVQRFLDGDGHHRRDEREHTGGGERFAVEDLHDACVADGRADEYENVAEQDRGDALELLVTVGVAGVGRLVGKDCADHHDQRAEDVGRRVYGVGHYGRRVRHDAGDELEHRQCGVADDADGGYLHGHALGIIGCGSGFTHEKDSFRIKKRLRGMKSHRRGDLCLLRR